MVPSCRLNKRSSLQGRNMTWVFRRPKHTIASSHTIHRTTESDCVMLYDKSLMKVDRLFETHLAFAPMGSHPSPSRGSRSLLHLSRRYLRITLDLYELRRKRAFAAERQGGSTEPQEFPHCECDFPASGGTTNRRCPYFT